MSRLRIIAAVALVAPLVLPPPGPAADDPPAKPASPPPIRAVAFSPDGELLVAAYGANDQPGGVLAWDVDTRKARWQRPGTAIPSVSFAPDGKSVAVATLRTAALLIESATGKVLGELGPHPADVRSVVHIPGTDL